MAPAVFVLVFSAVFHMVCDTKGETELSRGDIQELLRNQIDPSSWSTRVRRLGSSEDIEPPFWANRGRSESGEEQPPFWGNRGRDIKSSESEFTVLPQTKRPLRNKRRYEIPSSSVKISSSEVANMKDILRWLSENKLQRLASCWESISNNYPMYVDEPQYLLMNKRGSLVDRDVDLFWKSRGRRETEEDSSSNQLLSRLSIGFNKEFSMLNQYEPQEKIVPDSGSRRNPSRLRGIQSPTSDDNGKFWNPITMKKFENQDPLPANNSSEPSFMK